MTKTTQQLAERVLERLKVIPAGDTPEDADAQSVKDYYANVFGEMSEASLVFWEQTAIDERAFEALADFIAGRMASDFGIVMQTTLDGNVPETILAYGGKNRLRRMAADVPTGFAVTGDYF